MHSWCGATMRVEASMMVMTAVSATIGNPYAGATIVEVVAAIVTVNREVPSSCTPAKRTEEVVGCRQQAVLPVVQDATQVVQTIVIVNAIEVRR